MSVKSIFRTLQRLSVFISSSLETLQQVFCLHTIFNYHGSTVCLMNFFTSRWRHLHFWTPTVTYLHPLPLHTASCLFHFQYIYFCLSTSIHFFILCYGDILLGKTFHQKHFCYHGDHLKLNFVSCVYQQLLSKHHKPLSAALSTPPPMPRERKASEEKFEMYDSPTNFRAGGVCNRWKWYKF